MRRLVTILSLISANSRLAPILTIVALLATTTCKKLEDGTELDVQMFALIWVLTNYAMNENSCASLPYQNAVAGQSFGPLSSSFECFRFGNTGAVTAQMTTNGTALGRFTYWNPLATRTEYADNPVLNIPASSDLWVMAICQQDACQPWSVQF